MQTPLSLGESFKRASPKGAKLVRTGSGDLLSRTGSGVSSASKRSAGGFGEGGLDSFCDLVAMRHAIHAENGSCGGGGGHENQNVDGNGELQVPSQEATMRRASTTSHAGGFKLGEEPPSLMARIPIVGTHEYSPTVGGDTHQVMLLDSQASFPESLLLMATMDPEQSFPDAHAAHPLSPIASGSRGPSRTNSRSNSRSNSRAASPVARKRSGRAPAPLDLKNSARSNSLVSSQRRSSLQPGTPLARVQRSPSPTNRQQGKVTQSVERAVESAKVGAGSADNKQQDQEEPARMSPSDSPLLRIAQRPLNCPRKRSTSLTSLYQDSMDRFADMWSGDDPKQRLVQARVLARCRRNAQHAR